jgi:glucosyl-3-phosphoglycerate phosphatase
LPAAEAACIARIMILLRHGQSEFNLHFTATRRDPGIVDARLTELGHLQAAEAAELLSGERVNRIITSPYTRALETAAPLGRALGVKVLINPIVRERYAFACDVGTPRTELERAWPGHDFSVIDEVWWPAVEEPAASVIGRAALFRAEMAALPDWSDTVVVSHWGFILSLTGKSVLNGQWLRYDPTEPAPEEITWRA